MHQGIAVYGNKGSTDQHAYVQQLRDGVPNFFVTFIEVRKDRATRSLRSRAGRDQRRLSCRAFCAARARRFTKAGAIRSPSACPEVDAFHVGALIALYERAVGFYGSLVNVNAYHQPGVEAGKKAATRILQLQPKVLGELSGSGKTAEAIAQAIGADPEDVYHVLRHLAANDPAHSSERRRARQRDIFPRVAARMTAQSGRLTMSAPSAPRIGFSYVCFEPSIPWSRVTKFIRQLNHDVRNHLNAIELQSAFVGEIVEGRRGEE